ncbi:MAG: hypothetical protein KAQ62_10725 [Cyclobacteriaceae bacterium]|nr:hypothetical protein [Cyclobacteriaceae bacterium]MCK5278142.1 hypothetical protein [Cyclobacteriaceae bacterium]MCK5369020.1 hypothetical protein [Cyclobacteriaceae bacterium]
MDSEIRPSRYRPLLFSEFSTKNSEGLAAGDYTLEVCKRLAGNSNLFTRVFTKTLSVN